MPRHRAPTRPGMKRHPDHVLFFAAIPPPGIADAMAEVWNTYGTGARLRRSTLHLSIYQIASADELDPVLVRRARQMPQALRTAPFTLRFDCLKPLSGGAGNPALAIMADSNAKLDAIASDLHAAARRLSLPGDRGGRITPHVTLAYGPSFGDTRPIGTPILWTIEEIALIDSHFGKSHHASLGQWPLPKDREQQGFDF